MTTISSFRIAFILIFFGSLGLAFAQNTIPKDELMGKGSPKLIERSGYKLRPEAAEALDIMKAAAAKEGIGFQVVSSTRDYAHQNRIWESKYNTYIRDGLSPEKAIEKIIEYSTIPGTSRHHWGTDVDIVDANQQANGDLLVPSKFHGDGPYCKFKEWMEKNAGTYGFYLVYTQNANRKGFNYEPWHYSYKALSLPYLTEYKKLKPQEIFSDNGLLGSEHFSKEFMARYLKENVLDINPELLP